MIYALQNVKIVGLLKVKSVVDYIQTEARNLALIWRYLFRLASLWAVLY